MSRIFILGDSFADNLYSKEKESIDAGHPLGSGIARYVGCKKGRNFIKKTNLGKFKLRYYSIYANHLFL